MQHMPGRARGLDSLRLIAALLVMWGHAWPLHDNAAGLGMGAEQLGVGLFFALSGTLVTLSWRRDPSLARFAARRALRLLPGLWACVLLTTLLLAPLVGASLWAPETWAYLRWMALLPASFQLPGVFPGNPGAGYLNSSLWTIPLEALCYVAIVVLGCLNLLRPPLLLAAAGLAAWGWWRIGGPLMPLILLFLLGAACAQRRSFRLPRLPWPDPPVDISYGVYLYAFPMQQLAIWLVPGAGALGCLLLALPPTLLLAFASWHLVERPSLAWKPALPLLPPRPAAIQPV